MLFQVVTENTSRFKPFEIKAGMSLAPLTRKQLTLDTKKDLDEGIQRQVCNSRFHKDQIQKVKCLPELLVREYLYHSVPDKRGVSGQKPKKAGHLTRQNK